jgi:hypothetical protein
LRPAVVLGWHNNGLFGLAGHDSGGESSEANYWITLFHFLFWFINPNASVNCPAH